MSIHSKCLICNSESLIKLGRYYERHSLVKCKDCGFVFTEKKPSISELTAHYKTYNYHKEKVLSPITIQSYRKLLNEFESYRKTNRILDIGCGRAGFLIEAKKMGWEVYGTEFSKEAVEYCKSKHLSVYEGKLDPSKFDNKKFDVITSFEVIEHINNPLEELANIKRLLRRNGLFYCTTPNFNALQRFYLKEEYSVIEYPEHLSYYTKNTLTSLAKRSGLKPIKFLSTGVSLNRMQPTQTAESQITNSKENRDEALRSRINSSLSLQFLKRITNSILTLTNTGLTLKGYFEKA